MSLRWPGRAVGVLLPRSRWGTGWVMATDMISFGGRQGLGLVQEETVQRAGGLPDAPALGHSYLHRGGRVSLHTLAGTLICSGCESEQGLPEPGHC